VTDDESGESMDDESGESMKPMEEVPLIELAESKLESWISVRG